MQVNIRERAGRRKQKLVIGPESRFAVSDAGGWGCRAAPGTTHLGTWPSLLVLSILKISIIVAEYTTPRTDVRTR